MYVTTKTSGLWYCGNLQSAQPILTQLASYPFQQPERVFYNPYNPRTSFGNGLRVGYAPAASGAGFASTARAGNPHTAAVPAIPSAAIDVASENTPGAAIARIIGSYIPRPPSGNDGASDAILCGEAIHVAETNSEAELPHLDFNGLTEEQE